MKLTPSRDFRFIDPTQFRGYKILVAWSAAVTALEVAPRFFNTPFDVPFVPGPWIYVFIAALGFFLFRERRIPPYWWLSMLLVCIALIALPLRLTSLNHLSELAINSALEEAIYRVAIPVTCVAALKMIKVNTQTAMWAGLIISTAGFIAVHPPSGWLSTLCLSVLWFLMIWRAGSLLAASLSHFNINLIILSHQTGNLTYTAYYFMLPCAVALAANTLLYEEHNGNLRKAFRVPQIQAATGISSYRRIAPQ